MVAAWNNTGRVLTAANGRTRMLEPRFCAELGVAAAYPRAELAPFASPATGRRARGCSRVARSAPLGWGCLRCNIAYRCWADDESTST